MRAPSCIKALVAATIPVLATGCGEINADRAEFRTDQVSANGKQFAFMHVLYAQRKTIIVIADDDTHSIKTFMSSPQQQASLWSAMLLSDKSFYVTASPLRNPPISPEGLHSTLYHCAVGEMPCERLFSADNSIDTPVKLPDGSILYTGGILRVVTDSWFGSTQQLMYVDFNFYRFANGESQKITDINAYELGFPSYVGTKIVFAATPRIDFKVPRSKRVRPFKSHIYCGELLSDGASASVVPQLQKPCIQYGDQYDELPNLSPDGRLVAFRSVPGPSSPWVVNLVALDLSTGKVIATIMPEKGHPRSLSRPIFVDDRHLKYVERRDDEKSYNLWIYDVEAQHGQVVSKISDADIEAAKPSIVGE
jgi:hypothetical protein